MLSLRSLAVCCCLLLLIPTRAVAAPLRQSAQCDIAAMLPVRILDLPYVEEAQITIGDAPLSLRICAPAAESATAHHLLNVLLDALPKLSVSSGLPLQGALDRQIVILPDAAFPPNVDGAFSRPTGLILLQRESAETTIVHEGAHYWANDRNFAEAWMVEGYADCAHPWQTLPAAPEAIEPLTAQLLEAQKLLDRYASLRDDARALGRTPPRGLLETVAALSPDAAAPLQNAQATLRAGRALDQTCQKLDAPCVTGWLDSWSGGELALADADINRLTRLLGQATQAEQRCGAVLAACRAVWQPYLRGQQFVETRIALAKLSELLEQASRVERRCGELADACRQAWQNALQSEQLWGLEQRLGGLDRMLAHGEELGAACAQAGWPCVQMWRAKFSQSENGDPQPALTFLDDIQGALPDLSQTSAIAGSPAGGINSWLQIATGPDAPTLLAGARRAFEAGDMADARALAEQALAAAKAPRTNWPPSALIGGLIALVLAGMLVLAGALVGLRSQRPRSRLASDNQELLEALLAQPPGTTARSPAEKIRKAA